MTSATAILIGVLIGVVLILLIWTIFFRSKSAKIGKKVKGFSVPERREFEKNLHTVINDLASLCEQQPSLIQPYLVLGNLYRINGEPQRSVFIHQNLLTEKSLSKTMRDRLNLELSKDLFDLGVDEKAVAKLREISERSPLFLVAQEALAEYFFERSKFEEAFQALSKILRRKKTWRNRKRAGYFLALLAQTMLDGGDLPEAKKTLQKAIGFDRQCVLALYLRAQIASQEGKHDDAIRDLRDIVELKPEFAFLAIPRLEDAFYAKQSFMRFGEMIEELTGKYPDNSFLNFSLGKYYRKKKLFQESRRALKNALEPEGYHLLAVEEFANLNREQERDTDTVDEHFSLLEDAKAKQHFRCNFCHTSFGSMKWTCPSCGRWETIIADFHLISSEVNGPSETPKQASRF